MRLQPQPGDMFTVTPHRLPHGPLNPGGWHCRITGDERDGAVVVQEMKFYGVEWRPGMSTRVRVDALVPLAVQLDLFGVQIPPTRTLAASGGRA